jgi:LPS export ABC transporter protein LptC
MKTFIILFLFILSCDETKKKQGFTLLDTPDQIFENYTTHVTKNGIRSYRLWTEIFKVYKAELKVLCEDSMIVFFYDEETDSVKSKLYSKKGEWHEISNDFTAIENVKVISSNGKTLLTDTLYYKHFENTIYSNTNVTIYTPTDTLYGTSFKSDRELIDITIDNSSGVSYQ